MVKSNNIVRRGTNSPTYCKMIALDLPNLRYMNMSILKKILILLVLYFPFHLEGQVTLNIELLSETSLGALGNDVWGYVDSTGREYAITGTRFDTQIFALDDPANPVLIKTIPGTSSIWRDFKSYKEYVYLVADEGTDALTIIDMSLAPDSISATKWTDTIYTTSAGEILERCHNLYIDEIGRAFLSGCNPGIGGIIILDLKNNPKNPKVIGIEDEAYSHDVTTRGDTIYTCEIYGGNLGIYDISDPANPLFKASQKTSSNFTHNAWPSDDGRYIFTTDERGNGYVDAYDISDYDNITLLDQYRPADDASILPHNTHYLDGFLITSWYTEGVIVLDAHRPHNLIRVGQYDTNPQDANGNWGAYPYLPSGLLLATDMDNGFFVLKPQYQRAAYVEGKVINGDNQSAINAANVKLVYLDGTEVDLTTADGTFATGAAYTGVAQVIVSHPEYFSDTTDINMIESELIELTVELKSKRKYVLNGTIRDINNKILSVGQVVAVGEEESTETLADVIGEFNLELTEGSYQILVGKWGYLHKQIDVVINDNTDLVIQLEEGYQDDFFSDLGWQVDGTAPRGIWTRASPNATIFGSSYSNPNEDVLTDFGTTCYVTGNNAASVGADDVDDGITRLTSPTIDLSRYTLPEISLSTWYFNDGGASQINDTLKVYVLTDRDTILTHAIVDSVDRPAWQEILIQPTVYTDATDIKIMITAEDDNRNGHLVEAGVDAFKITEKGSTTPTTDIALSSMELWPNPATDLINIALTKEQEVRDAILFDISGNRYAIENHKNGQQIELSHIPDGFYFILFTLETGERYIADFIKIKKP